MAKNEPMASEVKAALSKIKDRERLDIIQAPISHNARMLKLQGNFRKRLQPLFAKAGVNIDQLNKVLEEYQSERRRLLEKEHAASAKDFVTLGKVLRNGIENRQKALQHLASKPFVVTPIPMLSADSIWATPIGMLLDSRTTPGDNWAKIKLENRQDTGGNNAFAYINFFFFWKNQSQYVAVINANADLVLQGWCGLRAETSFWGGSHCSMSLTARLRVFVEGQEIFSDSHQTAPIASISAYGGSDLFGEAGSDSKDIFGSFNVSCSNILVASDQAVLFEVGMIASYSIDNGNIALKFCDVVGGEIPLFDGSITCPSLNIELLTAPSVAPSPSVSTTGSMSRRKIPSRRTS